MTTTREIFQKIMSFESAERTLNWEFGYWGGTINKWYSEGLPKIKGLPKEVKYGETVFGPGLHWPEPSYDESLVRDFDISYYFKFDEGIELVPYNYWIFPMFEKKVITEDEDHIELYDQHGKRIKIIKDESSMPMYLEWPVKSRKDWECIKEERFSLDNIERRFIGDKESFLKRIKNRTFPLGLFSDPIGFFGSIRFLIGEENLFLLYYDDPKLIKDIASHLCELWISIAEELIQEIDFDIVCFWEDMSGKQGSLISPVMFRKFLTPYYKRIIDFLKSRNMKNFLVDTDGNVNELIPLFLEAGVNTMYPFERQAGNDILEIRNKYPELKMLGGFNKNTLFEGKISINKELEIIKQLIKKDGYIPFCDHLVPPNVSWENYKYFRNELKNVIFYTKVL
ncbi:MAG: hypothetical protein M1409_06525 [Actinobacteria bacterium]|nr:hypothetical protein [Actinomycetota bacterium]